MCYCINVTKKWISLGDSIFSSFNFLRLLKCHSLIRFFFHFARSSSGLFYQHSPVLPANMPFNTFVPACPRGFGGYYTLGLRRFIELKTAQLIGVFFFAWRMPFSGKTLKNLALSNSQSDHWTQSVSPIYAVCKEVICRRENDCENNQVQKLYCTWTLRNLFTYILTRTCLCIYALLLCRKCNSAILSFVVF